MPLTQERVLEIEQELAAIVRELERRATDGQTTIQKA